MYNRYIPNPQGGYTRVPQAESAPDAPQPEQAAGSPHSPQAPPPFPSEDAAKAPGGGPPRIADSLSALLRHGLDHLHLEHVDTGDLLLLGLLFFLFREQADEELLVALGLLLIL